MTTDKQDPSRKAFEISMVNACGAEVIDLARLDDGEYKWKSVREMWSIWQASREQALSEALTACETRTDRLEAIKELRT